MPLGTNIIPTMTSNTAPSGVASASQEFGAAQAWKAFDGVDTDASYWYSFNLAPHWLRYQHTSAKHVRTVRYRTFGEGPQYAPVDFTIRGSNDGTTWTVIDTQVGHDTTPAKWYEHVLAVNASYLYHEMLVSAGNGSGIAIVSLEMYEGTRTTTTFSGTGTWNTAGNWDNGVPDAEMHAVISGSGTITIDNPTAVCRNLDMSGFTGTWDQSSWNLLQTHGNITLGAGMTAVDGVFYVELQADATLTSNGKNLGANVDLECYIPGVALTFADDAWAQFLYLENAEFGTSKLRSGSSTGQTYYEIRGTTSWSTGAEIIVNTTGLVTSTLESNVASTLPPVTSTMGATSTLRLLPVITGPNAPMLVQSLALTGGKFNGSYSRTVGNATLTNVEFAPGVQTLLTVDGNFLAASLVSNGTGSGPAFRNEINVAGTAVASNSTFSNTYAGGTEIDASDNGTDGGGNTNINFASVAPSAPPPTTRPGLGLGLGLGFARGPR